MVEVTDADGTVTQHAITAGERTDTDRAVTLGLNLDEGKATLAGLRRVLVTAQVDAHCRRRGACSRCKWLRPVKDHGHRTLVSLFGTVVVRTPLRPLPVRRGVPPEPDPGLLQAG